MEPGEMTVRRAMQRIVNHLAHERIDYQHCDPAFKASHIWNAVRVLEQELNRLRLLEMQQPQRKVGGPTQGY